MMTAADWEHVENSLRNAYGSVHLICDGYQVTLQVNMIAVRQYAIVPYVNGWTRGEWITKDCEERRRFLRPHTIRAWRPKGVSRKTMKAMDMDPDRKTTIYNLHWTSFARLKSHLIKNNKEIALAGVSTLVLGSNTQHETLTP